MRLQAVLLVLFSVSSTTFAQSGTDVSLSISGKAVNTSYVGDIAVDGKDCGLDLQNSAIAGYKSIVFKGEASSVVLDLPADLMAEIKTFLDSKDGSGVRPVESEPHVTLSPYGAQWPALFVFGGGGQEVLLIDVWTQQIFDVATIAEIQKSKQVTQENFGKPGQVDLRSTLAIVRDVATRQIVGFRLGHFISSPETKQPLYEFPEQNVVSDFRFEAFKLDSHITQQLETMSLGYDIQIGLTCGAVQ